MTLTRKNNLLVAVRKTEEVSKSTGRCVGLVTSGPVNEERTVARLVGGFAKVAVRQPGERNGKVNDRSRSDTRLESESTDELRDRLQARKLISGSEDHLRTTQFCLCFLQTLVGAFVDRVVHEISTYRRREVAAAGEDGTSRVAVHNKGEGLRNAVSYIAMEGIRKPGVDNASVTRGTGIERCADFGRGQKVRGRGVITRPVDKRTSELHEVDGTCSARQRSGNRLNLFHGILLANLTGVGDVVLASVVKDFSAHRLVVGHICQV